MKLKKLGIVHSCFKQKFGTPRQSGLCQSAKGTIELFKKYSNQHIARELDLFSHIWVLFHFHKAKTWNPTVRPPRLGGTKKVGVFASRSPFRPNPIGISIFKLEGIERRNGQIFISVSGLDVLDQTPVLDIKPYVPSIDSRPFAKEGWVQENFNKIEDISFIPEIKVENADLIKEVISLDPRPAHQKNRDSTYKLIIGDSDVHWRIKNNKAEIFKIVNL